MLAAGISINEAALAVLCRRYGVARLSLFGSVLRGDFVPGRSDVDVLVEFLPGARRSLFTLLKLERELTKLFGHKVDLNTPGSLSSYFREKVVRSAEVLYDAA